MRIELSSLEIDTIVDGLTIAIEYATNEERNHPEGKVQYWAIGMALKAVRGRLLERSKQPEAD